MSARTAALRGEPAVGQRRRGHQRADDHEAAAEPGRPTARAGWCAGRRGAVAGSPRTVRRRESKPTMTYAAISAERSRHRCSRAAAGVRRVEHDVRTALGVGEEHADDGTTPTISQVTPRCRPAHPARRCVDRGGEHQQDGAEHDGVRRAARRGQRRVLADELEAGPDRWAAPPAARSPRSTAVTICAITIIQPANQPTTLAAEPPGPLVDRAGDRVARGEFGEAQGHQQLAEEHAARSRRTPAAEAEAQAEQLEDRGQDRHEREAGGERGEVAEPSGGAAGRSRTRRGRRGRRPHGLSSCVPLQP